jgi:PST family polysaccharide transporter
LIVTPFLARVLMKDGFGHYVVINSCVWTSSVFMEYGFYLYGITRVASSESSDHIGREASAIVSGKIALTPICVTIYFLLAWVSGVLTTAPYASILGCISALAYGGSFAWYFQGRQQGGTAVALEGVPQVLQLILFLLLIRTPSDLWLALLIQALAPIGSVAASLAIIRRRGIRLMFSLSGVRDSLHGAKPYFVERLCFTFYTAINPVMVAVLASVQEAALYSIGDKVGIFLAGLALPVSQTMMPVLTQLTKRDGSAWRVPLLVVGGTVVFCGGAALFVFIFVGYAFGLVFSPSYAASVPVARVFCVAAAFSCLSMSLANFIIIPRGAAKLMMWSSLAGLIVSLLVQVAIVPHFGAIGAAWARAAAGIASSIILGTKAVMLYRQSRCKDAPIVLQDAV